MHKPTHLAVLILAISCYLLLGHARAQDPGQDGAAFLIETTGTVDLVLANTTRRTPLRPGRDSHRLLQQGDTVQCGPDGSAKIEINGQPRLISPNHNLQIHFKHPISDEQRVVLRAALDALRNRGFEGGSKGLGSPLWSPPRNGVVRPSTGNFGWNVSSSSLELTLANDDGETLWSAKDIDSREGHLAGVQLEALQRALLHSQLPSEAVKLTATFRSEHAHYQTVFEIISKDAEGTLNRKLAATDVDIADPALRLASKGQLLIESRVYAEAAITFESALALDPSSETLLTATAIANELTGNLLRADELRKKRLQPVAH